MTLSVTLHLVAGLGALAMGGGILLREPRRGRNRSFFLLCLALAVWNLGLVLHALSGVRLEPATRMLFLLGSCSSAPLALLFTLELAGSTRATRVRWCTLAGVLAALVWIDRWAGLLPAPFARAALAIGVLGGIGTAALAVLGHRWRSLPPGPERRAFGLLFWGGIFAVVGGVTDFLPRGAVRLVDLGPLVVLLFLLLVCAVIVRYRFLDVDVFLLRAVSLLAGATATGLVYFAVVRYVDPRARFLSLFLVSLMLLALVAPLGRVLLTRARSWLAPTDPLVRALQQISRRLTRAASGEEVRRVFEDARGSLPPDAPFGIHLRRADQRRFHLLLRYGDAPAPPDEALADDDALPRLLQEERMTITRRYLESESRDARGERRARIERALEQLTALDLRLAVPLFHGERLQGWIGAGSRLPQRYVTEEVATALQAVGHQATACLERIGAVEDARRRDRLAAVGELAAGLAHEVRNPVAAIRGAAQAMGPEATERQRREMREVIREETERLDRVVGEFLSFARPARPRREPVDLLELARRSLKAQRLAGRRIDEELLAPEPVPLALGDADQLLRVIDNLVLNAWEAAGDGVRIRVEIDGVDEGHVALRLEDNGPGITAEESARVFQPFHTTKAGGVGLGLALVHRIVEAHAGEIRVESRPGLGAAFTVLLPAAAERGA